MAIVACVALASFAAYDLFRERGLATQEARGNTANLARLLEEQTRQTLRRVELMLNEANLRVMQVPSIARADNPALRARLQSLVPSDGLLRGFELADANGIVLVSTLPAAAGSSPAAARDRSVPGQTAQIRIGISTPELGRDGRWSLPVVQPVVSFDGHVDGVLTAIVDAAYVQPTFDAIDTGSKGFVTLFHAKGWILATAPANPALFARNWSDTPMFREHLPRSPTGTVQQVVVRDGTERIYSYRALKDYPVVVSIGVSLTDALAEWRARVRWDAALLAMMTLLLMGAAAVMTRQLTRREAAERALAESSAQTRAIVEGVADGIVTIDSAGRVEAVNRAGEAMFGYPAEALLKRDVRVLLAWPARPARPDAPAAVWLRAVLQRAAGKRTEASGRRIDGSVFPMEVSVTQTDRGGQPLYVALVRDTTQQKRFEAELKTQRAELEVMNRELEDFAFLSSHDLQEPLRKIRSFAQLLRQRIGATLEARSVSYLDYIEEAGGRLHALIRDLLEYSRTSRGPLTLEAVDLKQLAAAVVNDLSPAIAEAHATVQLGELPVVQADATQMRLLLQNLLSNALKFRGPQAPLIAVWAEVDGSSCRLNVRDNGIGIDPKYHTTIFQSLKRLHTREQYLGTGLGLAICNRVAERHGGQIHVASALGEGSVFTLTIPLRPKSTVLHADRLGKETL